MILKNGKTLRWGTYAMYLFCERNNCDLEGLLELLSSMKFNLKTLSQMIQVAYYAANKTEWELESVFDWIDENGGVFAKEGELIEFANYVVKATIVNQSNPINPEGEVEKKS
jgi:hypothetical protein